MRLTVGAANARYRGIASALARRLARAVWLLAMALALPLAARAGDIAVLADGKVVLGARGVVKGDMAAAASSRASAPAVALRIGPGASVYGDVDGDGVELQAAATVTGTVSYRNWIVRGDGIRAGAIVARRALSARYLPPFLAAAVPDGAADVTVPRGRTVVLPGDAAGVRGANGVAYGDVVIEAGGTLVFRGGRVNLRSVSVSGDDKVPCGGAAPAASEAACRAILFAGATELLVEGAFASGANAFVGPKPGAAVAAGEIVVYAGGGAPERPAIRIGAGSAVKATLHAAEGSLRLDAGASVEGVLRGRDIEIGEDCVVSAVVAGPAPPDGRSVDRVPPAPESATALVANPATVFTHGAAAIAIPLTGWDPAGSDLVFAIATPPEAGHLTLDQAPPGFPGRPAGCDSAESCIEAPENDSQATASYRPDAPTAERPDGFVFEVADGRGRTATARVEINPRRRDNTDFFAGEVEVRTSAGSAVAIRLPETTTAVPGLAAGCRKVDCAGPKHGVLSALKPLADPEDPRGTPLPTVVYTPEAGFAGSDGFEFEGCAAAKPTVEVPAKAPAEAPKCAVGRVMIGVEPLAEDRTVEILDTGTEAGGPVEATIVLQANAPGEGGLTYSIASPPTHGSLTPQAASQPESTGTGPKSADELAAARQQTFVYSADSSDFSGTDSFEYTVLDSQGHTETGVVTIVVKKATCQNDAGRCVDGRRAAD